jgi:Tol biopolymer transport system component
MFASKLAPRLRLRAPTAALALPALLGVSLRGGIMRKLTAGSLAAMALLLALTARPAAARPRGTNGQIVFGRAGHSAWTINPDGTHEQQLLPGFAFEFPVWSLDGSAIVAYSDSDPSASGWIIDPDTGAHRALPNPDPDRFDDFFACGVPSPDFERLACGGGSRTDPSVAGIYTIRTSDGGGLRRLTSDTIEDEIGDYSPDGKRLVYFHFPPEVFAPDRPPNFDLAGLSVVKVNGTGTRKIAPCCSSGGSWSPQGNDIVFSWRPPALSFETGFHSTIWIVHSDGSGLHQIHVPGCDGGPNTDPDAHGCANATWSPDGKKILFRLTTPGFGEGGDLYTVNADGTGRFQVTHDGDVDWPNWGTHPLATG